MEGYTKIRHALQLKAEGSSEYRRDVVETHDCALRLFPPFGRVGEYYSILQSV